MNIFQKQFSFRNTTLLTWILSIVGFMITIALGTNLFRDDIQSTKFGSSDYFIFIMVSFIVTGLISFLMFFLTIIFKLISKIIKPKSLIVIILFILLSGLGGYFYLKISNYQTSNLKLNSVANIVNTSETNSEMKNNLFKLVNEERVKAGLNPLKESEVLDTTATDKANDMIAKNYWAHISPDGTQPWAFFGKVGYGYRYAGENLARDYSSSEATVVGWMNSPDHKKNILDSNYTETGIAVIDGSLQGISTKLAVQHFGTPYKANLVASKTGNLIKYREWCTGTDINVYENEIIVKKSSDGGTYGMTNGDWTCYENYLSGKTVPNRVPARTGKIISYKEWCSGKDISIYDNELVYRMVDGKSYSMTQGDWDCYDKRH